MFQKYFTKNFMKFLQFYITIHATSAAVAVSPVHSLPIKCWIKKKMEDEFSCNSELHRKYIENSAKPSFLLTRGMYRRQ